MATHSSPMDRGAKPGYSPWGCKELDMTKQRKLSVSLFFHRNLNEIILCGNLFGFYCQGYAPYGLCVHLPEKANDSCCHKYPQSFSGLYKRLLFSLTSG